FKDSDKQCGYHIDNGHNNHQYEDNIVIHIQHLQPAEDICKMFDHIGCTHFYRQLILDHPCHLIQLLEVRYADLIGTSLLGTEVIKTANQIQRSDNIRFVQLIRIRSKHAFNREFTFTVSIFLNKVHNEAIPDLQLQTIGKKLRNQYLTVRITPIKLEGITRDEDIFKIFLGIIFLYAFEYYAFYFPIDIHYADLSRKGGY